jgi:hypothetical protein
LTNQKQGASGISYLLHSSLAAAQLCCGFYQPQQTEKICRRKTNFLSQIAPKKKKEKSLLQITTIVYRVLKIFYFHILNIAKFG